VLRNLIDNALKNTKDGQITLSVFSGVNYLNIAVQDTGGGFNNDILTGILVTVNGEIMKEIIPKFNGGLGFNIIAEFLKSENALICIQSEQGVGTKIILSLPKQ
jgi:signal transduction histidine kinase